MSKLSDDKMKELLKSVRTDFDKDLLWNEIDSQMIQHDEKRKNKGIFWWLSLGVFLMLLSAFLIGSKTGNNTTDLISEQYDSSVPVDFKSSVESFDQSAPSRHHESLARKQITSNVETNQNLQKESSVMDVLRATSASTLVERPVDPENKAIVYHPETSVLESINRDLTTNTSDNHKELNHIFRDPIHTRSLKNTRSVLSSSAPVSWRLDHTLNRDIQALEPPVLHGEKVNRPFALLIQTHAGRLAGTKSRSGSMDQLYLSTLEASNKALYEWGGNAAVQFPLNNSFSLVGGLSYNQKTELFRGMEVSRDEAITASDSASFFTFENGLTAYYEGDVVETDYSFRRVQHYNKIHAVGAFLGVRYQYPYNQWNFYISEGLAFENLIYINGKNWTKQASIVDYTQPRFLDASLLTNVIQVGVERRISKACYLSIGLLHQADLTQRIQWNEVRQKYQSASAQLGLRYML